MRHRMTLSDHVVVRKLKDFIEAPGAGAKGSASRRVQHLRRGWALAPCPKNARANRLMMRRDLAVAALAKQTVTH